MSKCDYGNEECGRIGHDCAFCYVTAQHLCNSCENTYPECGSTNVKFGCDEDTPQRFREGRDNIFYCDRYKEKKGKQSNADRIHSMNIEELAELFYTVSTFGIKRQYEGVSCNFCYERNECAKCWKEWLELETEEGEFWKKVFFP